MEETANDHQELDCAICLQKCHHPTKLPCGHIFCFLCVKGVALQSKKCAMCRTQIPSNYFDNPILLENLEPEEVSVEHITEEYQWFYEGRNGWWKYDERSNIELESAFNSGQTDCRLLLAGALYCIDFPNMVQVRCTNPTRRRRVKRDLSSTPALGIAGIKTINENSNTEQMKTASEQNSNVSAENNDDNVILIEDGSDNEAYIVIDSDETPSSQLDVNVVQGFNAINLYGSEANSESSVTGEI